MSASSAPPVIGNLPDGGAGEGAGLLPSRRGLEVDRPVGVGGVAATAFEPLPDRVRLGLAEQQDGRDAPPLGRLEEEAALRLLAEARVHQDPLPLEQPAPRPGGGIPRRSARSTRARRCLPRRRTTARISGGDIGQLLAHQVGADHGEAGPLGQGPGQGGLARAGQPADQDEAGPAARLLQLPQGQQPAGPGLDQGRVPVGLGDLRLRELQPLHLAPHGGPVGRVERRAAPGPPRRPRPRSRPRRRPGPGRPGRGA